MSVEVEAGRPVSLVALRRGAALALALAAMSAGALPAVAQSAPDAGPAADDDQPSPTVGAASGEDERDRVYVLGRRVVSSVATVKPEDVTQVVNVIDGETLMEQGVASLEQALRNVPGITTQIGEGGVMSGDQFFIRGLSAKNDVFTDGLRDFGVFTRDSFNYGQVEVFKGPSASAFGRGAAGGGINTTSKTPYADTAGNASIAIGDGEYARVTGDWNQLIGDGVAVRVAGMIHQNENTGRDRVYSERWGIAPSVAFGLGTPTTITAAYLHQDEEKLPDYGIPTTAVGTTAIARPVSEIGVDSTNYYGFAGDIDETIVDTFTVRVRHDINSWASLTSDTKYGYYQRHSQYTPTTCNATCTTNLLDSNPATIPLGSVGGPGPYEQDTQGVQNITTLAITAPIGGLRNELMISSDVSWQDNDRNGFSYVTRDTTKDLLNPQLGNLPVVSTGPTSLRYTVAKDVSVFVTDRLWLNDQWSITAGVRQAYYEVDQDATTLNATATCNGVTIAAGVSCRTASNTDFLTPQVGVIYEPVQGQSYYVSYSSSARPPGVSVANGDTIAGPGAGGALGTQDLDPEENTNIEAGARIALFDDRLQLQGAIFQTKKDNAKEIDPLLNAIVTSGDSLKLTGIELGLAGAITDEWSINANFTYVDTEITDSTSTFTPIGGTTAISVVGNKTNFVPETAASLWTTYNFTGALLGLEVGGGVTYQDDVFLNVGNTAVAPGYTTLDGLVSYAWDRFRVSLNGYNLSDETYFAQVHGNRVTPGQGRTFIATLGVVY
ncbi:MAG TPA: TonB-dependent receptor [Hyphomonadaceae bacterium]|nr:TonB-dependent receptor [Hyphomonadaceae bacterium]